MNWRKLMSFEVGKIYRLFWICGNMKSEKAVGRCVSVDNPKIPGMRPVTLSVSPFFDSMSLYWFCELEDYCEEATEEDLNKYAKSKEKDFKIKVEKFKKPIQHTGKIYEQMSLF